MTIDRYAWAFRRNARLEDFLTTQELIETLVTTVSCGGKYSRCLDGFTSCDYSFSTWLARIYTNVCDESRKFIDEYRAHGRRHDSANIRRASARCRLVAPSQRRGYFQHSPVDTPERYSHGQCLVIYRWYEICRLLLLEFSPTIKWYHKLGTQTKRHRLKRLFMEFPYLGLKITFFCSALQYRWQPNPSSLCWDTTKN